MNNTSNGVEPYGSFMKSLPYQHPVTDQHFISASIHPLHHRRNFASLCYAYKLTNNFLPPKLDLLIPNHVAHPYPTRNPILQIPGVTANSLAIMDKSPICVAIKHFNVLPALIKNSQSLADFKTNISELPWTL
eukprot:GHVO01068266.1.p1 GENE.GHVO01068266.1~~GHVO01068266.1.p1  ORF type:complete len:133 (+),score=11.65 GHVO01068266.1:262-660(+)